MKFELLAQGDRADQTLSSLLSESLSHSSFDRLEVAVAYATKQGVRTLEIALRNLPSSSFWVIGLDDAITQPEALEFLMALSGAQVRVVAFAPSRRFHPKLYCLSSTTNDSVCVSAIGSGNMTLNGFRRNGETAAILLAETASEVEMLREQWRRMWEMGTPISQLLIDEYRVLYKKARAARRSISKLGVAPAEPAPEATVRRAAAFDGDPKNAVIAWTEAGSPSAGGLDLEFPRNLMPYFALPAAGGTRRFRTSNGVIHSLRFTYRSNNQMWRLLFSADAVEAMIGRRSLRPGPGQRSEFAVVFERSDSGADFELSAVRVDSSEFILLAEDSKSVGGLNATHGKGGRQFGFY